MKDASPQAIYLADYTPPAFLVDEVHLTFRLAPETTRVLSRIAFRPNPDATSRDFFLHGENLRLIGAQIDGQKITPDVTAEGLTAEVPDAPFIFEAEVEIAPISNTALEGLYMSSDMYCTQCEAEGFRKITYYPDRPDVMGVFTVRIEGDQPVMLSNGNPVAEGDGWAEWHDPWPKPSYLFALVAGDLVAHPGRFTTRSGRDVALNIWVRPGDEDKCAFGMEALKKSMKWDEDVYGREYDLDLFNIVAVDDFNMGAMENKGLNIFNSSCVLASQETATDMAFQRIESIVAHEYFHNWSGNRVTCRDWFQLSLKEGFTVFRDSQFSSDMGSPTVKRIEDASMLRTAQFAEDAGPMAHPVRPESYMEITNFYTLTIYEKGCEVVGMIRTLLGEDMFRKGSDLYFERHDGQAVTTNDFVRAMEDASGRDLSQFRLWYEQAGTPELTISDEFDQSRGVYSLTIEQAIPDTPGQTHKKPQHIPFALGLLGAEGEPLPLMLSTDDQGAPTERVLELTEAKHTFEFHGIQKQPVPSLLRHFSAPVRVNYPWTREQLTFLMSNDPDGFNRWDAGQKLAIDVIRSLVGQGDAARVDPGLIDAYRGLLADDTLDQALVAKMLQLPSEAYLIELSDKPEVQAIHGAREKVLARMAGELRDDLLACYHRNTVSGVYEVTPESVARRSLRNTALGWLLHVDDGEARSLALAQYADADNMTDRLGALRALVGSGFESDRDQTLADFYERFKADPQVVEQWFSVQAASGRTGSLPQIRELMQHPAFDWKNPNKIRSVIGAFAGQNLPAFHSEDGSGYEFLVEQVCRLDDLNPQIAARLVSPLTRWRKFAPVHGDQMSSALEKVSQKQGLSRDVYEVVHKSLAGS